MATVNYWAVVVAAAVAFLVGAVWYSPLLFGKAYLQVRGMTPGTAAEMKPRAGEMIGEFVRSLVVAYVLARFVVLLGVVDWMGAVRLGGLVWLGFQASLLVGAVLHENMPWKLYAIHVGDALVKTLLMTVILAIWR